MKEEKEKEKGKEANRFAIKIFGILVKISNGNPMNIMVISQMTGSTRETLEKEREKREREKEKEKKGGRMRGKKGKSEVGEKKIREKNHVQPTLESNIGDSQTVDPISGGGGERKGRRRGRKREKINLRERERERERKRERERERKKKKKKKGVEKNTCWMLI